MNRLLLVVVAALAVGGCASSSTKPRPGVVPVDTQSGFLESYANLRAGGEGDPTYFYRMPNAGVAKFDKIVLEAVEVWRGEESAKGLDREATQFLADYLFTLLYLRLHRDYEMVDVPDATTMRVRVAYTKVGETNMKLDVTSSRTPRPNLIPQFKELAKQPPRFAGSTSVELAIRDAQSGVTFYAAIERKDLARPDRVGEYGWDDLEAELKYDADRIGYILCTEREGAKACPRPVLGR